MERGGTNFLLSLCEGAVTSFVMLPCPQKVQLQIISQLWEIPPDVNNYLRMALHPEKKPWMKRSDGSPRTCAGTCLRAQGFVSFPHRPQPPPRLGSAAGFKDLIPTELWPGFSARLGSNIHGKVSSSERRLQAAFMGWQRAVCSDDDVTLRRTSVLKYPTSGSGKQHVTMVATRQGPGWSHAMVIRTMMHILGKRPSILNVCTALPQRVSPVSWLGLWRQGPPRTAGPAHPGMDTWAVGLCLLPARPKEVSLCKHGHNRRKP